MNIADNILQKYWHSEETLGQEKGIGSHWVGRDRTHHLGEQLRTVGQAANKAAGPRA